MRGKSQPPYEVPQASFELRVTSSPDPGYALRMKARGTWRPREGSRNGDNTAIRRALSPLRPCGSVTADVHGCPRGVEQHLDNLRRKGVLTGLKND